MNRAPDTDRLSGHAVRATGGFTLVELLITISITAILLSLAVPSFANLIASSRAKTASTDIFLTMTKARSEAVKRNRNVAVTLAELAADTDACKAGQWLLQVETPGSDTPLAMYCMPKGLTLDGPEVITYQSSGRIQDDDGLPYKITADAPSPAHRCVDVDPSGRPYVIHEPEAKEC